MADSDWLLTGCMTDDSCDCNNSGDAGDSGELNRAKVTGEGLGQAGNEKKFVVFKRMQVGEDDGEEKVEDEGQNFTGLEILTQEMAKSSLSRGPSSNVKPIVFTDEIICGNEREKSQGWATLNVSKGIGSEMFGEISRNPESSLTNKRSPSNKLPVKVFATRDKLSFPEEVISQNRPILGKKQKFAFPDLTIDVEEANKQLTVGRQPLQLSRVVSQQAITSASKTPKQDSKETVEFVRAFYQEQTDKLSLKNEELLRENERLRIELTKANREASEAANLKQELADLKKKIELFGHIPRDSPIIGGYGELKSNIKSKANHDSIKLDIRTSELHCQSSYATIKDSLPGSAKLISQRRGAKEQGFSEHLGYVTGNREFERPLLEDCSEDKSLTYSRTSQEQHEFKNSSKMADYMEEYQYDMRRVTSQNASFDTREIQDKDANYLKDFISKLKMASEGISKNLKMGNSHKKTASLVTAQGKRRDLTGYYVTQKKTKDGQSAKVSRGTASRLDSLLSDKADSKLTLAVSRSHATNLVKTIEKSFKHQKQVNSVIKESCMTMSNTEDVSKEVFLAKGLKKSNKDKGTKVLLEGLLRHGPANPDSKTASPSSRMQVESYDTVKHRVNR